MCSITQKIIIKFDGDDYAPTIKEADGTACFAVERWDRALCIFLTGEVLFPRQLAGKKQKPMNASQLPSINEIYSARAAAGKAAVLDAMTTGDEVPEKTSKRLRRMARADDAIIAPTSLTIQLQPWADDRGVIHSGVQCQVLFDGIGSGIVWVELRADVIDYLVVKVRFDKRMRKHIADHADVVS